MTSTVDRDPALEVPTRRPLHFPSGMPGFESYTRFTLIGIEGLPIHRLECDEEPAIALPLADAGAVFTRYTVELSEADAEEIGLGCAEDAQLFVVLTLSSKPGSTTANLMAPIVVSTPTGRAKQLILDGSGYSLRHPIQWD